MSHLTICRAVQSSCRAIARMGQLSRQIRDCQDPAELQRLSIAFARAQRRFEKAQQSMLFPWERV